MKTIGNIRLIRGTTSLLFGGLVLLFWGLYYPYHLHYHEQLQLFLFTPDYWSDKLGHPGGIAEYLAEFLTQFYFHAWTGALILAGALVILQRQIWWLARQTGANGISYPLSFLPAMAFWIFLCDEHAMLAALISTNLTLAALMGYRLIRRYTLPRILYVIVLLPLLYWIAGGAFLIFVITVTIHEAIGTRNSQGRKAPVSARIGLAMTMALLGLLAPLLAQELTQYPLKSLFLGIDYYRFPEIVPNSLLLALALSCLVPLLMPILSSKGRPMASLAIQGLLLLWGGYGIYNATNSHQEEVLAYDYLTRMKRWQPIIRMAERKQPMTPFTVACLNLALAKTGQLGDRMFHFYQNGYEGLIPSFQRDFLYPLSAAEIFYHLGMVNSSQRYTFEAMEAIPDYKKSGRAYVRLAETNLINGQYEVAAKYLRALTHTIYYRRWALNAMSYLNDEDKINAHPDWGWLRQARYTKDFLFSDTEMENMLGLLLEHNPKNRLAYEYLMAYTLQKRDLQHFMAYYPLGKELGYDHIPLSYQEALIFVWTQQHPNFQNLPWSISQNVLNGVTEFAHVYMSQKQNAEPLLRAKYGKTYWYYLLLRK